MAGQLGGRKKRRRKGTNGRVIEQDDELLAAALFAKAIVGAMRTGTKRDENVFVATGVGASIVVIAHRAAVIGSDSK